MHIAAPPNRSIFTGCPRIHLQEGVAISNNTSYPQNDDCRVTTKLERPEASRSSLNKIGKASGIKRHVDEGCWYLEAASAGSTLMSMRSRPDSSIIICCSSLYRLRWRHSLAYVDLRHKVNSPVLQTKKAFPRRRTTKHYMNDFQDFQDSKTPGRTTCLMESSAQPTPTEILKVVPHSFTFQRTIACTLEASTTISFDAIL